MPRYTVTARSFINGSLAEAGDVVDYAGWPGSSLEPADEIAARIKDAYAAMRKKGKTEPRNPDISKYADPPQTKPAPNKDKTDA